MDYFEQHLGTLIDRNGYNWGSFAIFNAITDIKITFDKSDENRPFQVDMVEVKAKGCDWVEMTKGIDTFKDKANVKNQTVMGYIANIDSIGKEINGRTTPPWLDFVVKYTFPPISVNYGISNLTTDPVGSCALSQLEKLDDFILDEVLSFSKAFQYQLNKKNCKMLSEAEVSDPLNPSSEKEIEAGFGISKAAEKIQRKC